MAQVMMGEKCILKMLDLNLVEVYESCFSMSLSDFKALLLRFQLSAKVLLTPRYNFWCTFAVSRFKNWRTLRSSPHFV